MMFFLKLMDRVPLKLFPRFIIKNIVVSMVSSLKDVDKIHEVKIVVKKDYNG